MATARRLSKAELELLELIRKFEQSSGKKYDPNSPMAGGFNKPKANQQMPPSSSQRPPSMTSVARQAQRTGVDAPTKDVDAFQDTIRQGRAPLIGTMSQQEKDRVQAEIISPVVTPIKKTIDTGLAVIGGAAAVGLQAGKSGWDTYEKYREFVNNPSRESFEEIKEGPERIKGSIKKFADTYGDTEGSIAEKMNTATAASRELYPEIPDWMYFGAEIIVEELGLLALTGSGSGLLTGAKVLKITAQALSKYDPAALKALGLVLRNLAIPVEVTGTAAKGPIRFENWVGQQGIDLTVGAAKLTGKGSQAAFGAAARGLVGPGGPDSAEAKQVLRSGIPGMPSTSMEEISEVVKQGDTTWGQVSGGRVRGGSGTDELTDPNDLDAASALDEANIPEVPDELPAIDEATAVKQAVAKAGTRPVNLPVKGWKIPTTAQTVEEHLEQTNDILENLQNQLLDATDATEKGIKADITIATRYQEWLQKVSDELGGAYDPPPTEAELDYGRWVRAAAEERGKPPAPTTASAADATAPATSPMEVGDEVYFDNKRYEVTKRPFEGGQVEITQRTKDGKKLTRNPAPMLVNADELTRPAAKEIAPTPSDATPFAKAAEETSDGGVSLGNQTGLQKSPFEVGNTVFYDGNRYEVTAPFKRQSADVTSTQYLSIVRRANDGAPLSSKPKPILVDIDKVSSPPTQPSPFVVAANPEEAKKTQFYKKTQDEIYAGGSGIRPTKIKITKEGKGTAAGEYVDLYGEKVEISLLKSGSSWQVNIQRGNQVSEVGRLNSAPMTRAKAVLEVQRLIDDPNFSSYVEGGRPPELIAATKDGPARWTSGDDRSYAVATETPIFTEGLSALPADIQNLPPRPPRYSKEFDIDLPDIPIWGGNPNNLKEAKEILAELPARIKSQKDFIVSLKKQLAGIDAAESARKTGFRNQDIEGGVGSRNSLNSALANAEKSLKLAPEWKRRLTKSISGGGKYRYLKDGSRIKKSEYDEGLKANLQRVKDIDAAESARKMEFRINGEQVSEAKYNAARQEASDQAVNRKLNLAQPAQSAATPTPGAVPPRGSSEGVVKVATFAEETKYTIRQIQRGKSKGKYKVVNPNGDDEGRAMTKASATKAAESLNAKILSTPSTPTASVIDEMVTPDVQFTMEKLGNKYVIKRNGVRTNHTPKTQNAAQKIIDEKNNALVSKSDATASGMADDVISADGDAIISKSSGTFTVDTTNVAPKIRAQFGSVYASGFKNFPESLRSDMAAHLESLVDADADIMLKATRRDNPSGAITDKQREELARKFAEDKGIPNWKPGKALNAEEIWLVQDVYTSNMDAMQKLKAKVIAEAGDETIAEADKKIDQLELLRLALRGGDLILEIQGAASEAGRALRTMRAILSGEIILDPITGKMRPDVFSTLAKKLNITQDKMADFASAFSQIDSTNPGQLANFISSFNSPTKFDYIYEQYINAILSSPYTHARNLISNMLVLALSPIESSMSAGLEAVGRRVGFWDRPQQRFFSEEMDFVSIKMGFAEGVKAFGTTFMSGVSPNRASKLEFYPRAWVGGKWGWKGKVGKATSVPTRMLEASDAFFYSINNRIQTNKFAIRQAHEEGLSGGALLDRIVELKNHPPTDLLKKAEDASNYRLFRQDLSENGYSGWMQAGRNKNIPVINAPLMKLIVPFLRTPTNLLKFGLERSPFGLLQGGITRESNTFIKAVQAGDPQAIDIAGKSILGTTAMIGIALAFDDESITGSMPTSAAERDEWKRKGIRPYSIKLGGHWVEYQRLEPFNSFFAPVAAFKNNDLEEEGIGGLVNEIGKGWASQSWVAGISDLFKAINSDESSKWEQLVARVLISLQPYSAATRLGTQINDPAVRQNRPLDAKGMFGSVLNIKTRAEDLWRQESGMSKKLLPQRDAYGRTIQREFLLSPIAATKEDITFIDAELKLADINIGTVTNKFSMSKQVHTLPYEWHDYKKILVGQARTGFLTALVNSPQYQEMNDIQKKDSLNQAISRATDAGTGILIATLDHAGYDLDPKLVFEAEQGLIEPQIFPNVPYSQGTRYPMGEVSTVGYEEKVRGIQNELSGNSVDSRTSSQTKNGNIKATPSSKRTTTASPFF